MTRGIRSQNAISDEQLAYIGKHGGVVSDDVIAKALGMHARKVLYFRARLGIPAYVPPTFWTQDKVDLARELYCVQGLASPEAAKILGCSDAALRRKANRAGWDRDPRQRNINATRAQRARWADHVPVRAPTKKVAKPVKTRLVGVSDRALIEDFLTRQGVTLVEPGIACGLSAIERQFGAYKPTTSWSEQRQIAGRNAASRNASPQIQHEIGGQTVDTQSQTASGGVV